MDGKKLNIVIYIDKDTDEVYDKKSVNSGNPHKLYHISKDNKLKKIKY